MTLTSSAEAYLHHHLLGQDSDMAIAHLNKARAVKNDEFYTQPSDVARGMAQFTDRDPDVFRGKTVLLPCDDPEWSAFTACLLYTSDAADE